MIEFNVRDQNKLWPHLQPEGYTATEKKKKKKSMLSSITVLQQYIKTITNSSFWFRRCSWELTNNGTLYSESH